MGIFLEPFVRNAYLAATLAAVCAGVIGYFVVLRRLSFASHALAHVGFTGATAAVLIGADLVLGTLLFTVATGYRHGLARRQVARAGHGHRDHAGVCDGVGAVIPLLVDQDVEHGHEYSVRRHPGGLGQDRRARSWFSRSSVWRRWRSSTARCCSRRSIPKSLPSAGCLCDCSGVVFMMLLAWTVAAGGPGGGRSAHLRAAGHASGGRPTPDGAAGAGRGLVGRYWRWSRYGAGLTTA